MARIMIECPKTRKPVPTGEEMEPDWFNSPAVTMGSNVLEDCPACGETHTWSHRLAFLET